MPSNIGDFGAMPLAHGVTRLKNGVTLKAQQDMDRRARLREVHRFMRRRSSRSW
jgi:hypothetical protein